MNDFTTFHFVPLENVLSINATEESGTGEPDELACICKSAEWDVKRNNSSSDGLCFHK